MLDGASVGFILPFTTTEARAFWQDRVFGAVRAGGTALYGAVSGGRLLGTVQLGLALPPNQPHRADVAKLLVHPDGRRQGLARALMQRLETDARAMGKRLLVLDTRSGDPASQLYLSLDFRLAGEIPGYCRNPATEVFEATTYMYKPLDTAA